MASDTRMRRISLDLDEVIIRIARELSEKFGRNVSIVEASRIIATQQQQMNITLVRRRRSIINL